MRYLISVLSVALAGCATVDSGNGHVLIETVSQNEQLSGARCVVKTDSSSWSVVTPADVLITAADGNLRVACNKAGYRASEMVYRAPSGLNSPGVGIGAVGGSGGGVGLGLNFPVNFSAKDKVYPSRVLVEMERL
ncbi:hypothetical protein [Paraherbaspirillum soli]|uniref:Lipoprotein n=1 Tax=Paraherbaspirillum soli TaxID=631222 RepID=A0ABW0M7U3_9BURK